MALTMESERRAARGVNEGWSTAHPSAVIGAKRSTPCMSARAAPSACARSRSRALAKCTAAQDARPRLVVPSGTGDGPRRQGWHAVDEEGIPLRELAQAIVTGLGLSAVSIPADESMVPGHFGSLAAVVTLDRPASSAVTREVLGWEPVQPGTIADLDNGNYFPAD